MAVVRYVGASGPATIPMAGRRPRRERQAVTELLLARRHGRGGGANPQLCRSPTTVAEPGPVTCWRTFRDDRCHDRTKLGPVAQRVGIAMAHWIQAGA